MVEGTARTSFTALAAAAERLAGGLAARGVRAGDVVALQLPNWTETLAVLLAAARLGAVANPVLPVYRRRELGFILAEAGARVLFIPGRYRDCDHRALVRELRPALQAFDAEGYLRITGRRKDIIIRKGENISARELEDLLAAHPAVAEVAVVGVPDPVAGEIACAVLRLRPGARPPTLAEVAEHLTARGLSRRKLPERLEVVADFPRTASGKIVKRALRERLRAPA